MSPGTGPWKVTPTITALRKKFEEIRKKELEKTFSLHPNLSEKERHFLEAMTSAILNKILQPLPLPCSSGRTKRERQTSTLTHCGLSLIFRKHSKETMKRKESNRMRSRELRIGTRGSQLALYQANWVKDRLTQAHPGLQVSLIKIKTTGDKILDAPLAKVGGKGLFVKEIEDALLEKRIDLAVHSIKDVTTEFPEGLHLSAITKREDPRDVFISKDGTLLMDLRQRAKIGTSSLRRQAQILHLRKDFEMIPLRGNVNTRLKKLETTDLDGIILALAGVRRLGFEERVTEIIPLDLSLPAIGQGALGIETRIEDGELEEKLRFLNDPASFTAISGERTFLKRLQGGCQVPIAAYGQITGSTLRIDGLVGTIDGKRLIRGGVEGDPEKAEALGLALAEDLLSKGAKEILDEVYRQTAPYVSIEEQNQG